MKQIVVLAAVAAIIGHFGLVGAWAQQPKLIKQGQAGQVVEVGGDNLIVVTGRADCPSWSVVSDICFADVMGQMQQSGAPSLRTIGTSLQDEGLTPQRVASTGAVYEVVKQGESFAVTKVGPLDPMVPVRCGRLRGQSLRVEFDASAPQRTLRTNVTVVCDGGAPEGAGSAMPTQRLPDGSPAPGELASLGEEAAPYSRIPMAGSPLSIYEFYGDTTLLVFPQANCAPEDRLFNGACFSRVKGYMQQNGYRDVNVVLTDANYTIGSVLSMGHADVIKVLSGDYVTWKARHAATYDAGIRYPGGCQYYGNDPNKEGVIIVGPGQAQFYERMACPPLR